MHASAGVVVAGRWREMRQTLEVAEEKKLSKLGKYCMSRRRSRSWCAGFQLVVQALHQLILCSGCNYLHASYMQRNTHFRLYGKGESMPNSCPGPCYACYVCQIELLADPWSACACACRASVFQRRAGGRVQHGRQLPKVFQQQKLYVWPHRPGPRHVSCVIRYRHDRAPSGRPSALQPRFCARCTPCPAFRSLATMVRAGASFRCPVSSESCLSSSARSRCKALGRCVPVAGVQNVCPCVPPVRRMITCRFVAEEALAHRLVEWFAAKPLRNSRVKPKSSVHLLKLEVSPEKPSRRSRSRRFPLSCCQGPPSRETRIL